MTNRNDWLTDSLRRYLDRRTMPQGLKDKPRAQADEVQALVKTLVRIAPVQGYQDWWDDFSDRLAEQADTRAWPTQNEMIKASRVAKRPFIQGDERECWVQKPDGSWEMDEAMHVAQKIRAGEPVGDEWLWGRSCAHMQRKHSVTDEELRPYRSALFFADKSLTDETTALRREAERKARHAAALDLADKHDQPRNRRIPEIEPQGMA